jgi:hypothetical protein
MTGDGWSYPHLITGDLTAINQRPTGDRPVIGGFPHVLGMRLTGQNTLLDTNRQSQRDRRYPHPNRGLQRDRRYLYLIFCHS